MTALTRTIRDILILLLGAGGFIHEVLATGTERPTILLACLALLGVPLFLRRDEGEVAKAALEAKAVKGVSAGQGEPGEPGEPGASG